MAATKEILELTARILEESNVGLDESLAERIRQLGDASCKAGIEAAIEYLSEKSELSEAELKILSGGDTPEHHKLSSFADHLARLPRDAGIGPTEKEKSMCRDAFNAGVSTAILYLVKTAKLDDADLLSLIPSAGQ